MSMPQLAPWLQSVHDAVEKSMQATRLPHAILLDAAPGWGVVELAENLAATILGANSNVELDRRLDFLHIELEGRARFISINQIRDAIDFLSTTAREGERKLVLIKQADKLSIPASQALLKVLEEPPADKHVLLTTTNSSGLLPTIRSRCQKFVVQNGSREQVTEYLASRLGDDSSVNALLSDYGGAPFAALEAFREKRLNLTEALSKFARTQTSLVELARELRREEPDDVILRWQYVTLRLAHNSAVVGPVATFYDELSDVRRQFREVPGLDRERQFLRLLIKWQGVLRRHQRLRR